MIKYRGISVRRRNKSKEWETLSMRHTVLAAGLKASVSKLLSEIEKV